MVSGAGGRAASVIVLARLLPILVVAPGATGSAAARSAIIRTDHIPASAPGVETRGPTTALAARGGDQGPLTFVRTTALTEGEGELDDLEIVPLDPSRDPDLVMRSRPFIIDPDAPAFCACAPKSSPLSQTAARDELERFLVRRGLDQATLREALLRYDDPVTANVVPEPSLRAALLMLSGWEPYQATIAAVLDGANPSGEPFVSLSFADTQMTDAVATLIEDGDGRFQLVVDRAFASEPPEQLIPVLVHESLHGGGGNSEEEEVIANILDTIAYAEVVLVDADVAAAGTDLAIFNNAELVALLNSTGRAGPGQLGISSSLLGDVWLLAGDEANKFDAASIRDAVQSDEFYASLPTSGSPGQQTLTALLSRFPEPDALGDRPAFDEAALTTIDRGVHTVLGPDEVVALAEALGLELVGSVREGPESVPLPGDATTALSGRPFVPRDRALFDFALLRKPPAVLGKQGARKALVAALQRRGLDEETRTSILVRYDDPATAAQIPHPVLRAATLLLSGWEPWDATLGVVFDGENPVGDPLGVRFADLPFGLPVVWDAGADDRGPALLINRDLMNERPELLASYLVEGTLLGLEQPSEDEAITAQLIGTLAYGDMVSLDSGIARVRTAGTIARNRDLLALLNSGPRRASSGTAGAAKAGFLGAPRGVTDILPRVYVDATSFADYVGVGPYGRHGDDVETTPAPPVFADYLDFADVTVNFAESGLPVYDRETSRRLDSQLGTFLTENDRLRMARALRLGVAESEADR